MRAFDGGTFGHHDDTGASELAHTLRRSKNATT